MKDVIEKAKTSYDERYKILKQAKNNEVILDLRREKRFYFVRATIIKTYSHGVNVFWTRFFANRHFEKMIIKYNLKEE